MLFGEPFEFLPAYLSQQAGFLYLSLLKAFFPIPQLNFLLCKYIMYEKTGKYF